MALKTFECTTCNHREDHNIGMMDIKPTDPCSKCGESDPDKFERKYVKAPSMRNDGERNPGGLRDWRKGKSMNEMANVYLDEANPY